jgi:aryl-alcohol dehydrogenase-like predicted oxidoreductase
MTTMPVTDPSDRLRERLGGHLLPPLGYGAFKIGRNQAIKYDTSYDLPADRDAAHLLNSVVDLGMTWIDTAPSYGISEARIGMALSSRRDEVILSTKVGEIFENGTSRYDFSSLGVRDSLKRSLERLQTDAVDFVLIHAPANDVEVLQQTDVVAELLELRSRGLTRAVGLSAKSLAAAELALQWADVLMLEYNQEALEMRPMIERARATGVAVVVKKGLASGRLPADQAIQFVLAEPGVQSLTVSSLKLDHLRANLAIARRCRPDC